MKQTLNTRIFNTIHTNNLIYNTCWEDPRLDRQALNITPDDNLVMITSAGCNALDYALLHPETIHAVDMNPRQNALLELKTAAIRSLEFDDFFMFFGQGRHPDYRRLYQEKIRQHLNGFTQSYWDRSICFFSGKGVRNSFYFHGTSGLAARLLNLYINTVPGLRSSLDALLNAAGIEHQQRIYYTRIHDLFWKTGIKWICNQNPAMYLLGVPQPQITQIRRHYKKISTFIMACIESVFAKLPLYDNYFWRVYLTGSYTVGCCPQYLKKNNFYRLKNGLVDCITPHTSTITDFLKSHNGRISKFVLLDHMDWLSTFGRDLLQQEWQQIINKAAPETTIIWRSGGLEVDFIDPLEIRVENKPVKVGELLSYRRDQAFALHRKDRVHTYGNFYIADLALK